MKKLLLPIFTILLALICMVPSSALAGHIISVDPDIDCDGYKVTVWAYVHAGYTVTMDATLSNDSGYFTELHHSKTFNKKKRTAKAVFAGSWDDVLCEYYDFSGTVTLSNQCGDQVDSENGQTTLSCNCNQCTSDEDCDDNDLCNGIETCVNNQCISEIPDSGCGACEGKVTQLTLRYSGEIPAYIDVVQKDLQHVFQGTVQPGGTFTFNGGYSDGTLGNEISIFVDDDPFKTTKFHTSCSVPIGPGLVKGDFEVVEGYSRYGGLLCPLFPTLYCDDGNSCTNDWCDPLLGCMHADNTLPCDDGDACTSGDVCLNGGCQPGSPLVCDDGDGCTEDTCDLSSGCVFTPITGCVCDENADCTDHDICNGQETCNLQTGQCEPGNQLDCDDEDVCTDDWCDAAGGCQHSGNTATCDDGNACTENDACSDGDCEGILIICNDGNGCTVDTCNPETGCAYTPISGCECDEGSDCTDDDVCSGQETCNLQTGQCEPGTYLDCDDGNICTDDWCDAAGGCQHSNNTATCDDGNACTDVDTCSGGECEGTPVTCDDGNGCTVDTCNPATGCAYTPISGCECDEDSDCTDNDVCTGTERCINSTCEGGVPLDCDDGNVCTDDSCDEVAGCQNIHNTSSCEDGSVCTANDYCMNGSCTPGDPISCDDGNGCTVDTCNPATGCVFTPVSGCQCDEDSDCTDEDVCTGQETCNVQAGECVPGTTIDCDDGNVCTDDSCDPVGGCQYVNNTDSCNDENSCTANDTCINGDCAGVPVSCDDGNGCTVDTCNPLTGCVFTLISGCECDEGSDCSDEDVCTGQETCNLQTGKCSAGTPLDCDDGNICTNNWCDSVGGCQYANNISNCDDENACTADDTCAGGNCAGDPVSCDDGDGCTMDTCNSLTGCVFTLISGCQCDEDSDCNDYDVCTGQETCNLQTGTCVVGTPPDCDDGNGCTDDWCDGGCQHANNTDACDDGNKCTADDVCSGGTCGGSPITCDDGDGCTADTCNPATGCVYTPISGCECDEDADCIDTDVCNGVESCVGNQCAEGTPPDCDDGNICTDDWCDGGCQHLNNTDACDDDSKCTSNDSCSAGNCQGVPVVCDDGDGCTVDTCSAAAGCVYTPVSGCECDEDSDCSDDDVCTGHETCNLLNGTCMPGTTIDCDDGNVCTDDSCDEIAGCEYVNNTDACDDDSKCTSNDSCSAGNCQGVPVVCDDGDGCTVDTCSAAAGCVYTPFSGCECDEDSDCTDEDVCTGQETCNLQTGTCVPGATIDCDDGNVCTDDSCDEITGCEQVNNTDACDDSSKCTAHDTCSDGACSGMPISCDDGDGCTMDTCNPLTGCVFTPIAGCQCDEDSDCNDYDVCTGQETCNLQTGTCVPGTPLDCDDLNGCTDDWCDGGCQHADNTDACDDGNKCTADDVCSGGTCGGLPISCDDGDGCTTDTCNPLTGCEYPSIPGCECDEDADCLDTDVCNGEETCSGNTCVPGMQLECDDGNECTDDWCDGGCLHADNTDACDDNNACTEDDICSGGTCGGSPITCNDGDGCTTDTCNPLTGCEYPSVPGCECDEDADCLDTDVCNGEETCSGNTCVPGTPLNCDDGNGCTDDWCDGGCQHADNTDACDDENKCTESDTCTDGVCGGTPITCNDGDGCTTDTCNPLTGCEYPSVPGCECDEDADCNDTDVCNGEETCAGSTCMPGTPPDCDDGNECTNDWCDGGCQYADNTNACDDENKCTANDTCGGGSCEGTLIVCNDGDGCTTDTCNPLTGCKYPAIPGCECDEHSDCDDGDVCTGQETCNLLAGTCVPGVTLDCDDSDVCTDDSCDPVDGCQYAINTSPCDDDNLCTADDTCSVGVCQGTSVNCSDGNECTDDGCDPVTGCFSNNNNLSCNDDIFCNGNDTCSAGTCSNHQGDPCPPDHTCNEETDTCDPPLPCVLTLIPPSALLHPGETAQFTPVETGPCNPPDYRWTDTLACGDVDANGLFTASAGGGFASSSFLVDDLPETGEVCVTDLANGGIMACSTVTVVDEGSGGECDLLIYEGETPGRRNIPVQCDETLELCACTDCPDPCLEWFIDPPSTIGSTIVTHPDGTATYTAGCDCNKLVEETIVVVDTCNGSEPDSITVTVGTIELEVLDVYSRPGFAGVEVDVSLNNRGNSIKAMQLKVVDECDMLTCTECVPDSDRAIEFVCSANEQPDGSCKVVVYATDPSALITHGAGPVFKVLYNVHDDVPNTVCCGIYLEDISAADMFQEPLSVCTLDGQMCFLTCGDIYPQDCIGGDCGGDPFCGDGAVNLFDILEAIDIILGLTEYTECQFVRGDVPNGMPPYCGNPAGTPNCMADGDIDIFDVLVIIDRALGKANCCDYCYFGEIF